MDNAPVIDLIIPLYNAEQWIRDLIAALENQAMRRFRVIFVDDGSGDNTYQLLQTVLESVSFESLLLHQENRGPSAARNLGMEHARAEWIAFTDCDDALKPEYLAYLLDAVRDKSVQMGFCGLETIPVGSALQPKDAGALSCREMTAEEAMIHHYTTWIAPVCLILNRQWLMAHALRFDENCRYCEDLMFITQCIAAAESVVQIHNALYIYRTREGSLLRSSNTGKYINGIEGFDALELRLKDDPSDAVKAFFAMGRARFLLGILRRGAIQLPLKEFLILAEQVDLRSCREQIQHLPGKQKIAGRIYMVSRRLFHFVVRRLYKD